MAGEITTSSASSLLASQVIEREFYNAAYANAIVAPVVRYKSLVGEPSDTAKIPKMPKLTATAQTQGVDMTNTVFTPTSVTIACALAGLMITLVDAFLSSDIIGDPTVYGNELGKAVAEKIDTDIMSDASSFTSSVGTSGVALTVSQFLQGIFTLLDGMARPPFIGVFAPKQKHDLRTNIVTSTGAIWGASAGPDMFSMPVGIPEMLFGVLTLETITAASVNAAADRQGFMSPMGNLCGLAYVEKWNPRIEFQRDASKIAYEAVGSAFYGHACANTAANGGIKVVSQA